MQFHVAMTPPKPTFGYHVYWVFASERQRMYLRRLAGETGALTNDPVLATYRFTNPYRASDRVSQFLITDVIYDRNRSWVDTFARVLVFKVFNRIDTWLLLQETLGAVSAEHLLAEVLDETLEAIAQRQPLYSPAYIMPPPRNRKGPKFRRHLGLLRDMIRDGTHERIESASNMADAYDTLIAYESIGPFLAYQFITDLNYSPHLAFAECDFVVPGPGARRGLRKCFSDPGELSPADLVRWTYDAQYDAFSNSGLDWHDLWGRDLQLIDVQNLFCEVDKYTREANPDLSRYAPGKRIKQRYRRREKPLTAWFPPKWGINDRIRMG